MTYNIRNDKNCQMLYRHDINALTSPDGTSLTTDSAWFEGLYSSNPHTRVVRAIEHTLAGIANEAERAPPISFFVCQEGEHYVTLPYSVVISKVYAFIIKSPAGLKFFSEQEKESLIKKLQTANESYCTMKFKQLTLPQANDYRLGQVSEYVREWGMRIASPAPLDPSQKDLYANLSLKRIQAEIDSDKIGVNYPNTWELSLIISNWAKWYTENYPKAQIPVVIY